MPQMYDHTLNPLKGWPSPTALDFTGKLHSDVDESTGPNSSLPAGRVVHVDSYETPSYTTRHEQKIPLFKTGIVTTEMAIFTFQGSQDFDVQNAGGTDWYAIAPVGILMGLVATGAYELETTEYDTNQTYLPNETLTAVADDASLVADTGGGNLTNVNAVPYTDPVCGVVSRGTYTNAYGKSVLAFWPVYLPVATS